MTMSAVLGPNGYEARMTSGNALSLSTSQVDALVAQTLAGNTSARAGGIVSAYSARLVTLGGSALSDSMRATLETQLNLLMRSSAFGKIKALWVPCGATLAEAAAWLIKPAAGDALTVAGVATVAMTYGATTGITPGTQYLDSGIAPNAAALGLTATNWGYGVYPLSTWTTGTPAGCGTSYIAAQGDTFRSTMPGGGIARGLQSKGFQAVQVRNSVMETYSGSDLMWSVAIGSPSLPTANVQFAASGGIFVPNCTIGGGVIFEAMTQAEMAAVSAFFDAVNAAMYRVGSVRSRTTLGVAGDSIAVGTAVSGSGVAFPTRLATSLGLTLVSVSNAGRGVIGSAGGDTLIVDDGTNNGNKPAWRRFLPSVASDALVVLEYGTNDVLNAVSVSGFESAYQNIIRAFLRTGQNPQSLILTAPIRPDSATDYPLALQLSDATRRIADVVGCRFCDLTRGRLVGNSAWTGSDGIHPLEDGTKLGHLAIARDILDVWLA